MEAKVRQAKVWIVLAALLAGWTAPVAARAQEVAEWGNEQLNLRFGYPAEMQKRDPEQAMQGDHIQLFGISTDADPTLAAATHCLRPDLLLEMPGGDAPPAVTTQPVPDGTHVTVTPPVRATILLAELNIDCMSGAEQVKAKDLLDHLAEVVNKVPGMHSLLQPTWYNVGWQKVHVAAAQGQPQGKGQPVFTMAFSTNWNNHLLVWYISSNDVTTLNKLTKSTVRFGRAAAAPLYPVMIGGARP